MMNSFLSNEVFREGVSNYLNKHSYSNPEQDNPWESLTKAGHRSKILPQNLTVKTIMDSQTLQTGYPMLDVTRDYGNGKNTLQFSQGRFLALPNLKREDSLQCWWIPITFTTPKSTEASKGNGKPIWLPCDQKISKSNYDQSDIVTNEQLDLNAGIEDSDVSEKRNSRLERRKIREKTNL